MKSSYRLIRKMDQQQHADHTKKGYLYIKKFTNKIKQM